MKEKYLFISLIISLIFISGCFYQEDVKYVPESKYKSYENRDYGFSFEYPKDWEMAPKFGMMIAFEESDEEKLLAPYVGVGQQPILDPDYNIKDFAKAADDILRKSKSYTGVSEGYVKLGDIDGYEIIFDLDPFSYWYVYYYKDDSAFLLVCGALQPDFDRLEGEFEKIVRSYKVG